MNVYFIVEGHRTEKKVYPAWLHFLLPELSRISWAFEATDNNYYLFSGDGFPSLLHNHLKNSIKEVNELGIYKYLVLVIDVDDESVESRIDEVNNFIEENQLVLKNSKLIIITQNRCIETWFLGNSKVYKANPESVKLNDFIKFYDVKQDDPERMGILKGYNTHSQFHAEYCIEFLRERNIRYTKNNPNGVIEADFLQSLISRNEKTGHLASLKKFTDFCEKIKVAITT